ncbi:MAG: type IV pilus modification protein PilV [Pseudomonadota bacterium]
MNTRRRSLRGQRGTTLIEVLVAVLVLSFGLLGLAGLQGISLRSSGNAFMRTQATNLAYEILDQVRANRRQITLSGGPTNQQITDWENVVAATLPAGLLQVTGPGGAALTCNPTDCRIAVRLSWADTVQQGTDAAQSTATGYDTTDAALQWFEMDTRI